MAINWAKVRSAMTNTPDYNPGAWGGAGQHYGNVPGYKGKHYGQNQNNQWMRNFSSRPNAGGGADYMSSCLRRRRRRWHYGNYKRKIR